MLQLSVGCRVEEAGEESIRRRLRRALLDHVFPSASTNSVLKVDEEEETPLLPTDPGDVLVDTPSSNPRFWSRMSDNTLNEQFGNDSDWVSVLREGMIWYSGWPVVMEGIRASDYTKKRTLNY